MHIPYKTKNASTQHVCNPRQLDNPPIKKEKRKKKSTVYSTYMLTVTFEREREREREREVKKEITQHKF